MGKTYRRFTNRQFKKPSGRKNAIINGARAGAIPPDAYDDLPICNEMIIPLRVAKRLYNNNYDIELIIKKIKKKFNLKQHELNRIADILRRY